MGDTQKPVVIHGIRGYLARTETFVGDQVTTLQHYTPAVICHHRSENRQYDVDPMYVVNERNHGIQKSLGDFSYAALRTLTPHEVNAAAAWMTALNPAVLHFHFAVDAAFFAPLYKKLNVPAVVSFYGYDVSAFPNTFGGLGKAYLQRAFRTMDRFLVMSEDMKRDAMNLGVPEEKVIVHYYGINAARFRFDERTYERKTSFNILCVGTIEPKKGQHHLLRSLAEIRKQRPEIDARVTLVGGGPFTVECKKIVEEHGLQDRVEFAGHVPHFDPRLVQYYRNADVFVHFSTTQPAGDKEGIPGTIVEAMASGLPVITARHAGIPEAITNGTHGILLEEQDTAGIAKSLLQLYECETMRRNLGSTAARHALEKLNVQTKTEELEQIYEAVQRKNR